MPANTLVAVTRRTFILWALAALWTTVVAEANVINVPVDAPTIQAGIELATDGDTVFVAPGTYFEAIDFLGKTVTVESSRGAEETIIDATGLETSVVLVRSGEGEGTVLRGFTITGGIGLSATVAGVSSVSEMAGPGRDSPPQHSTASVSRSGGGVYVFQSAILIEHCIITNNNVPYGDSAAGGGVFVQYGEGVVLRHCTIEGNSAWLGGGLVVVDGDVQVVNCTFHSNLADQGGGLNVNHNASATIHDTTITENSTGLFGLAYLTGGGLSVHHNSTANFVSCHFSNNTSAAIGGGAAVYGHTTFLDNHFQENSAERGGGIASFGQLVVESSQFVDNLAVGDHDEFSESGRGGGIYADPGLTNSTTIIGSTFTGNATVDGQFAGGGGAFLKGVVDIDDCTFENNSTTDYGGALFFELERGAVVTLTGSTFIGNTAVNGGGALVMASFGGETSGPTPPGYPLPAKSTMSNCTFSENSADTESGAGGAVLLWGRQSGTQIFDCMFVGNAAWLGGGALVHGSPSNWVRPHFENCTFLGNSALEGGGVNFNLQGHGTVRNGIFETNTAEWGGAISVWNDAINILEDSSFSGNDAITGGGVYSSSNALRVTRCDFTANSAVEEGGAISSSGPVRAFFSTFNDNIAGERGGAVLLGGGVPRLVGCDLSGNSAGIEGGAIAVAAGTPKLQGMVVCENFPDDIAGSFTDEGGNAFGVCHRPGVIHVPGDHRTIQAAIDAASHGDEIIVAPGTYFEAINFSGKRLVLQSSHGPLTTVLDATGWSTSAVTVANNEGPGTTLRGFTITGGDAGSGSGGGVYTSGSLLLIDDCTISGNTAEQGGGIKANNPFNGDPGLVTITHSRIVNNHAADQGGGAQVLGTMSITGTQFKSNSAVRGAGLLVEFRATVTCQDCQFHNNISIGLAGAVGLGPLAHFATAGSLYCGNLQGHIHPVFGSNATWVDLGDNVFEDDCPILGDLNVDGVVDVSDLLILLAGWGPCHENDACPADLNGDGDVNVIDLMILLANWG